ncbi:MAG: fructose-1,6-bisphosphatase [Clostridia bacterium]|nr:fructose-1,6-bisphosphatase [Clostridia bacterium]
MNTIGMNRLLAKQFSTPQAVVSEIINLKAILNLPKGTEYFLSDIHGESETFLHILRNASGVLRTKIDLAFGEEMSENDKNKLAALIYYPERVLFRGGQPHDQEWYQNTIWNLIEVVKLVTAKYTRSKVRKAMPEDYRYIMDELINMPEHSIDKSNYYENIISSIIELGNGDPFIIQMSLLIQRLAIDHLHIVGDIYDRGNGCDIIMDELSRFHSFDIQWGNHDILWMGAYFGNPSCVCNVIRINCVYRNLQVIENYGINLRPLVTFATEEYADDPCDSFRISDIYGSETDFETNDMLARMTKAITVIQLKLENRLIMEHPEFDMSDRILYPSCELTEKEEKLIEILTKEFQNSKRLGEHMEILLNRGSMYQVYNHNLLMHGCVPVDPDGSFSHITVATERYAGKALYDRLDLLVRDAAQGDHYSVDFMWYLWCGKKSPLYGRDKMCVYTKYFEGYIEKENKDEYYRLVKNEDFCIKVLAEFGIHGEHSVIVNGHMPVKVKNGESPESGNCRHITIDGGLSKAYYKKTGIAGYTLINNSQGLHLVCHSPFSSSDDVVQNAADLKSEVRTLKHYEKRILVKETDMGRKLSAEIEVLKRFLREYYHYTVQ